MHIIFNFVNCCFYYVFSLLFVVVVVAVVNKECAIWRWTQPERWCGIICHELAQNGSKWLKLTVKSMYIRFQTTTLLPFVHLNMATRIYLHAVFVSFFVALFVFWDIFSSRVRVDIVQNIRTMSFCIVAVCLMFCLNFYFYFLLSRAFVFSFQFICRVYEFFLTRIKHLTI